MNLLLLEDGGGFMQVMHEKEINSAISLAQFPIKYHKLTSERDTQTVGGIRYAHPGYS